MRSPLPVRTRLSLLLVGVLAAGVTACGKRGRRRRRAESPAASGKQSAIPDNAALIAAITPDQALAAGLPPAVAQSKTINVGSNVQSAPNNFYAEDGKTPIGFEVDLAKAIGQEDRRGDGLPGHGLRLADHQPAVRSHRHDDGRDERHQGTPAADRLRRLLLLRHHDHGAEGQPGRHHRSQTRCAARTSPSSRAPATRPSRPPRATRASRRASPPSTSRPPTATPRTRTSSAPVGSPRSSTTCPAPPTSRAPRVTATSSRSCPASRSTVAPTASASPRTTSPFATR